MTVPFKKTVIPFLDELSIEAKESQSVNTIYKKNNRIVGHNTDIAGFELGLSYFKYNVSDKKVFILGSRRRCAVNYFSFKKNGSFQNYF